MTADVRQLARRATSAGVLAATLLLTTSCSHSVLVKSQPAGARVFVNKVEVGSTPLEFTETGSDDEIYSIRLEKESYQPREFILTPVARQSGFGCFLFSSDAFNLPDELEFILYPSGTTQPRGP